MKKLLAGIVLLLTPISLRAEYFELGVDQTSGSNGYSGTSGYAQLASDKGLYFKPRFNIMQTNQSSTKYGSYFARVGYDQFGFIGDEQLLHLGLEGGGTPVANGYGNASASADMTVSLIGGKAGAVLAGPGSRGEKGRYGVGLTRVDVGLMGTLIEHREDAPAATPATHVGQADWGAFAGVNLLSLQGSVQVMKSSYQRAIPTYTAFQPNLELVGVSNMVSGFPDLSYNIKVQTNELILFSPFVSYTYTTFNQYKTGANLSASHAMQFGVSANLAMLELRGSYQYYDPGRGYATRNYISLGASLNFGAAGS